MLRKIKDYVLFAVLVALVDLVIALGAVYFFRDEMVQSFHKVRADRFMEEDLQEDIQTIINRIAEGSGLNKGAAEQVAIIGQKLQVPVPMILAVMEQESSFRQNAVGSHEDRGYMQIIPETEKWLCEQYGQQYGIDYNPDNIFQEGYNIGLGSIYIKHLKQAYGENYHRIFTEYNRGYYKSRQLFEEKGNYETEYSKKVIERMEKFQMLGL